MISTEQQADLGKRVIDALEKLHTFSRVNCACGEHECCDVCGTFEQADSELQQIARELLEGTNAELPVKIKITSVGGPS